MLGHLGDRDITPLGETVEASIESRGFGTLIFKNDDVALYLALIKPHRHLRMTYVSERGVSTLEYKVDSLEAGYLTTITLDNQVLSRRILPQNIIAPVSGNDADNRESYFTMASTRDESGITASYTYDDWDGITQVTGPSYLIKYHHPDRATYGIGVWQTITLSGDEVYHNQMSTDLSILVAYGGWVLVFGVIGAAIGGAHGAFVAGVLGILFGFATAATLMDEKRCIWWWWGQEFGDWLLENVWSYVILGYWGQVLLTYQFLQSAYLRIGSWTFRDAINAGDP